MCTAVAGSLQLERSLELEEGQAITAMQFRDEDSSRHLLVAYGPAGSLAPGSVNTAGNYRVRVWSCESEPGLSSEKAESEAVWRPDDGYIASLEDHSTAVTRLAVSSTFLLTADVGGECRTWQKTRNFQPRAVARLHQSGGITDLAVDRLFAYSVGGQDLAIRVWSMPDLKQVLTISADSVDCPPSPPVGPGCEASPLPASPCRLAQLTAVRRPASRWSGAQGSARNSGTPRGMLFVAGTVAEKQDSSPVAPAGSGVLMEWALGATPFCQSAQVAHDAPIAALAYGPYDNGPLITADAWGSFRIWDYTPRLWCSQQVQTRDLVTLARVAIAVDPLQRALYTIVGDKRLFVWRQRSLLLEEGPGG